MLAIVQAFLLGSVGFAWQEKPAVEPRSHVLLPGGLVDGAGKVVYLSDRGRGVVALDASSGDVLWESQGATWPLALIDGSLAALEDRSRALRVVILDGKNGSVVREFAPIQGLPWVDGGEGRSLWARAHVVPGRLRLKWLATQRSPIVGNPMIGSDRQSGGLAWIDLDSGEVEVLPDDGARTPTEERRAVSQLPASVQELAKREHWQNGCVIGERVYGVVVEGTASDDALSSRQVETLQVVELATGQLLWTRVIDERTVKLHPPWIGQPVGGALLLGSDAFGMQGEPSGETGIPVYLPGGIVDPGGRVVYLTDRGRGVLALDAASGDVLWESQAASKPLVLAGGRLAALEGKTGELRVVVLDAGKGTVIRESDPIALPDWAVVDTCLDHSGEGRNFWARARVADGRLLVKWSAGRHYWGGVNPGPEVLKQFNRQASGVARIDLDTGQVELLADDETRATTEERKAVDQLPATVREVADRERWRYGCVIGERVYGVAHDPLFKNSNTDNAWIEVVQAVDLATGKLLWKRPFAERAIGMPPP